MDILTRHLKLITLFLSLVYACSLTGIGSVVVWIVDGVESHFFFPCKENGCYCDKAGRELPNCRCSHEIDELESSCCSDADDMSSFKPIHEDFSCCADADDRNAFKPILQETCFSEEKVGLGFVELLEAAGCGGLEEASTLSTLKHSLLSDSPAAENTFSYSENMNAFKSKSYNFSFTLKLLKVPIIFS